MLEFIYQKVGRAYIKLTLCYVSMPGSGFQKFLWLLREEEFGLQVVQKFSTKEERTSFRR